MQTSPLELKRMEEDGWLIMSVRTLLNSLIATRSISSSSVSGFTSFGCSRRVTMNWVVCMSSHRFRVVDVRHIYRGLWSSLTSRIILDGTTRWLCCIESEMMEEMYDRVGRMNRGR